MEKATNQYIRAQLIFWSSYFVLNLLFMKLWGASLTGFLVGMFLGLSTVLGFISHGFRHLYKTYGRNWSLLYISLQLIWLIPLAALSAQVILTGSIFLVIKLAPQATAGAQPVSAGGLLGYTINYCILLGHARSLYEQALPSRRVIPSSRVLAIGTQCKMLDCSTTPIFLAFPAPCA